MNIASATPSSKSRVLLLSLLCCAAVGGLMWWPSPLVASALLSLILAAAYRLFVSLKEPAPSPYAGEQLAELRRQARQLERGLLGRIESSSLAEGETQKLKAAYRDVRDILAAGQPRTVSEMQALLISLGRTVNEAHDLLDQQRPSQRFSTISPSAS